MNNRYLILAAVFFSGSIFAGCGQGDRQLTITSVLGVVTLDGTPLQDGVVELSDRKTGFAAGAPLDAAGQFNIARVPTGSYEIVVRAPYLPPPGEMIPPRSSKMGPIRPIPVKYSTSTTSGLTVTVSPGGISDLALKLEK